MNFTPEQEAIFAARGSLKINAVAGSGKTTTLVEYARRQNKHARILYIAFNRSVRMLAQKRFAAASLAHVEVQTAHSLAFRHIVVPYGFKVHSGYKIGELMQTLDIKPSGRDVSAAFAIASHVLKFTTLFCNSTAAKVGQLDYCAAVVDEKARAAVRHWYNQIEDLTRRFLAKMDRKEIDCTHEFYLKKFQLCKPVLPYDYILFDEGQDASPVMLDVFLNQDATKLIVGDIHQQIYGWRHATNALKQIDFPPFPLTTSFRFNNHIAALAMECLRWKRHLGEPGMFTICGVGANRKIKTQATIARTNLALLKNAIDAMQHDRALKKIYFEGNLASYTYAADGASIYDVLNLSLNRRDLVRSPLIAAMPGFSALEEFAETSEDAELSMLISIVNEYGKEIPRLLKKLSAMHVADGEREKADMIFSTLHRSKGMEYDRVTLTNDFTNEARVCRMVQREKEKPFDRNKLAEEINLAYVAVTRSRNFLDFPESMFPQASKELFQKKSGPPAQTRRQFPKKRHGVFGKSYQGMVYRPWTKREELLLSNALQRGKSESAIGRELGRSAGAIRARLKKMGEVF
ncbi:MAG: UvrD-helicase domain-containing protein [Chitinivibrionales bacterium]|nr:UvrD-helicase domain-containing protein [Chitinivibrionales bacterium]